MPDLDPRKPLRSEAAAHVRERQSGRALSLVLLVLAGVAVAGLGWALVEVLGDAGDGASRTGFAGAGGQGAAAAGEGAADPAAHRMSSWDGKSGRSDGSAELFGPSRLDASAGADPREASAEIAEANEAEAGGLGGRTRLARRNPQPIDLGRSGRSPRSSALSASSVPDAEEAAERLPRIAPGYAEILGVIPRTPGFEAKLRRDWQILEYHGEGVDGTATLRELWAQPDLPDRVSLVARDPSTGEKYTVEVPSGPLGLMLAPAYERP